MSCAAIRPSVEKAVITSTSPCATAWYISDESMLRSAAEGEAVEALERRPLRTLEELVVAADLEPRSVRGELADALRSPRRRAWSARMPSA